MGCDIHLIVEQRVDGAWQPVSVRSKCSWCDGSGNNRMNEKCFRCRGTGEESGYSCRNYDVFAMLANVRNGTGFAGCETGEGFVPISRPRGIPNDASALVKRLIDQGGSDEAEYDRLRAEHGMGWFGDHSHSWVTLRELLNYAWDTATAHTGEIPLGDYAAWKRSGKREPESYCGGASGRMVRHIDTKLADMLIEGSEWIPAANAYDDSKPAKLTPSPHAIALWEARGYRASDLALYAAGQANVSIYVQASWTITYRECAGLFYDRFIPALVALGASPDDVRLVFGFDS